MATKKKSRSSRTNKEKNKPRPVTSVSARSKRDIVNRAPAGPVSKSSSRSTVSGPAHRGDSGENRGDALTDKFAATQQLAADMPYNVNKPLEHGELATQPQPGQTVTPSDPAATGSTLTETTPSDKAGAGKPQLGSNPTSLPLDRVRVDSSDQALTTNQGVPIADNQNSLKAGFRGPALLQDFILREKITHFDHERIPERIVHARGSAAHGYFECYESLKKYTAASLFAEAGKRTPVFVRFSTVIGERGSADTARDVRGFAVKFYTDEGNFDLVGNNIPVFFIQDAMKFPDLVHAAKPEPHFRHSPSFDGARYFLGFYFSHAGIDAYDAVGDVRSRYPAQLPHDARLRRAYFPIDQ